MSNAKKQDENSQESNSMTDLSDNRFDDTGVFIIGANGQLGTALRQKYPNAQFADIDELDITDKSSVDAFDWNGITTVLNAAAYTNVDDAETQEGRVAAWKVNVEAVKYIVDVCRKHDMTLVHVSTDYVFDGTQNPHTEDEPFSPLSVYGDTKAAGDTLVSTLENHYILRTSWVIGEGKNFVRTMLGLAEKDISPTVVSDQIGRLTFTSELVRAIDHLLKGPVNSNIKSQLSNMETVFPYGTYNVSNSGDSVSWADVTREIFALSAHDELKVTDISTEDYYKGKESIAPRPLQSTLSLDKIHATGFESRDWREDLKEYITKEQQS